MAIIRVTVTDHTEPIMLAPLAERITVRVTDIPIPARAVALLTPEAIERAIAGGLDAPEPTPAQAAAVVDALYGRIALVDELAA